MDQRLSLLTLGVADLERAKAFYERTLGWAPAGQAEGVAFYNVGSCVLSLYPHADLARDMEMAPAPPPPYRGVTLALNLASRDEVDALFAELTSKGVTIVKAPEAIFWGGYVGFFADPDGHVWEVAHNPQWPLDADGRPVPPAAG